MSQENTNQSRNEGGQRRQGNNNRNRNGNNRNRNRNGRNRNRQGGQGRQNNKQGNNRSPQRRHQRKPLPLTTWEKILKFFGLYKEPTRPPRRSAGHENEKVKLRIEKTPKNNTRTAKSRTPRERKTYPVETPRLYLGNLSYDADEAALEELFKGVGSVKSVEVVYNRHTHRSKGFGFIEMQSVSEAKRAVEILHDKPFMGRNLIINGAKNKTTEERPPRDNQSSDEKASSDRPRKNRREKRERPASSNAKARLHVANISYEVDESSLEEHFKGIGDVRRVEIAYNSETHQSKGFGFVEMKKSEDAQRAIEILNDQFFMGRKLTISLAGSKPVAEETPTESTEKAPAEEPSTQEPSQETEPAKEVSETPEVTETVEAPTAEETPAPATEPTPEVATTPTPTETSEPTVGTKAPETPEAPTVETVVEKSEEVAETAPKTTAS